MLDLSLTQAETGLLDALPSALVVSDVRGGILLWNSAAERLYGHSRDDMLGGNVMELFVHVEDAGVATEIMTQVTSGRSWTGEFPVRCAGGATKRVRLTDSPWYCDRELVGVVGLGEEVDAGAPATPDAPGAAARADLDAALAELDGLRTAMQTRGTIEQAKGILMATYRIDADAAFELLRLVSQHGNRKLYDVACEVVAAPGAAAELSARIRRRAPLQRPTVR